MTLGMLGDTTLDVLDQAGAEIPGTGMTVSDLRAAGLSDADILALVNQNYTPTTGTPVVVGPPAAGQPGSTVAIVPTVPVAMPANTVNSAGTLPPGPAPRVPSTPTQSAPASWSTWFSGSTLVSGVPNVVVIGGLGLALMILPGMFSGPSRRRR